MGLHFAETAHNAAGTAVYGGDSYTVVGKVVLARFQSCMLRTTRDARARENPRTRK